MRKIVIAEDEALLRRALRKIIEEQEKYEICFEATNGQQALEYLTSHKTDILLTDIRMPIMDGLTLIEKISEQKIVVKAIVISGYNDFEYARHMMHNGAAAYLLKPLVPTELLEKLETICNTLQVEEFNRNILKSQKFRNLQEHKEVHFTNECALSLLSAMSLFACCIDFVYNQDRNDILVLQLQLEELFYPCCCFLMDNYLYIVYRLDSSTKDRVELVLELQSYCDEKQIAAHIGVGLPVSNMMQINDSMKQARKALHYYNNMEINEFVDYERISLLADNTLPYPLAEEKKLMEAVSRRTPEDIESAIVDFSNAISRQSTDSILHILTELAIFCKRDLLQYHIALEWENVFSNIELHKPWQMIRDLIKDLLIQGNQMLLASRGSSNDSFVSQAKEYITQHAFGQITLDDVTNSCFVSKSYFCKVFKEETGTTFKIYLNSVRIDNAKELLKNTSLKNYEISQVVGFEDPSYFNEIFKRMTGMTPSEYKNNIQ